MVIVNSIDVCSPRDVYLHLPFFLLSGEGEEKGQLLGRIRLRLPGQSLPRRLTADSTQLNDLWTRT